MQPLSNDAPEQAPTKPDGNGRRKTLRRVLLVAGPLVVVIVAAWWYYTGGRYVDTENAYVKADLVEVTPQVAGPIAVVEVKENQRVPAGAVLFRIERRPFRVALNEAKARLHQARNEIEGLKATFEEKRQALALAKTDRDYAERELKRQQGMAEKNLNSEADLDRARHAASQAGDQVRLAEKALQRVKAELGGDPERPVEQFPAYRQAQASREKAALDLAHTVVRAPFAGKAEKAPEPGQYVQPGRPVMALVSADSIWVEANFKETELTKVKPGQQATIEVDTYPGRQWPGRVESISQATGAEFSVLPPQNATGNWVKVVQRVPVRIAIDPDVDDPVLRAGMSTHVTIDTGRTHRLPGFLRAVVAWFGGGDSAVASR